MQAYNELKTSHTVNHSLLTVPHTQYGHTQFFLIKKHTPITQAKHTHTPYSDQLQLIKPVTSDLSKQRKEVENLKKVKHNQKRKEI